MTINTYFHEISRQKAVETYKLNYDAWGNNKSIDFHIYKETKLLECTEAGRKTLKVWVLQDDNQNILASCETFHRKVKMGERSLYCYSIASVFVPKNQRGKQYAKKLLQKIKEALLTNDNFLILYSSIGKEFYGKLGFIDYPVKAYRLKLASFSIASNPQQTFRKILFTELDELKVLFNNTCNQFYVELEPAIIKWMIIRGFLEKIYLHDKAIEPEDYIRKKCEYFYGLVSEDNTIVWELDFGTSTMKIMFLKEKNEEILLEAIGAALEFGMEQVEIWSDDALVLEKIGFQEIQNTSLPMVLSNIKGFNWLHNELYAWV